MVSKYWGSPQPRIDTRTRTRTVKCPSSGHQLQVPIISASSHFTSVMRRTNLEIVSAHKECWLRFSVSSRRLILYRITITRAVSGAYRNFTMPGGGHIPSTCLKCILALSWRRTKISRSLVDSSSYHGYCSLQFWNEKNYPFIDILLSDEKPLIGTATNSSFSHWSQSYCWWWWWWWHCEGIWGEAGKRYIINTLEVITLLHYITRCDFMTLDSVRYVRPSLCELSLQH